MIRITLGTMPSLLREIIASTLATQPDFDVTGQTRDPAGAGSDVLLLCSGTGDNVALADLLRANPPAIIALDARGEQAAILHLECREEPLSAPGDLCGIVREAARGLAGTRH
ncbi:hypothetical protein [Erythrobacter oryzae]|uniref:hypothetical protein n=1 Tax=Erythrobacter oryzae TaxID=3019556 RepID=UPI0025524691|nr:hypothetical protein [Erythrobacter sp. COR-2]